MVGRPAAALALLLTWVVWPVTAAGGQSARLDTRVEGTVRVATPRHPCGPWTSVEQLARQAGFVAGFESERRCLPAPTTRVAVDDALVFEDATPREMLDALVDRAPGFAWEVRDSVIVVRPVAADDTGTVLDRPAAPFRVRGVHVQEALQAVLGSASPSLFERHERVAPSVSARRLVDPAAVTRIDAPIDVSFSGGTLIDALNAVALAVGATWQAAYVNDRLHISVQTLVYGEGVTSVVSARLQ